MRLHQNQALALLTTVVSLIVLAGSSCALINIEFEQSSVRLAIGESVTLGKKMEPVNFPESSLVWESSDSSVAEVDSTGKVTGKAFGNAKITAKSKDDSSKSASTDVTVTNPSYSVGTWERKNGAGIVTSRYVFLDDESFEYSGFTSTGSLAATFKGTYRFNPSTNDLNFLLSSLYYSTSGTTEVVGPDYVGKVELAGKAAFSETQFIDIYWFAYNNGPAFFGGDPNTLLGTWTYRIAERQNGSTEFIDFSIKFTFNNDGTGTQTVQNPGGSPTTKNISWTKDSVAHTISLTIDSSTTIYNYYVLAGGLILSSATNSGELLFTKQ